MNPEEFQSFSVGFESGFNVGRALAVIRRETETMGPEFVTVVVRGMYSSMDPDEARKFRAGIDAIHKGIT